MMEAGALALNGPDAYIDVHAAAESFGRRCSPFLYNGAENKVCVL